MTKPAIVITGASTGIGFACAVGLCNEFRVFGTVRKDIDAARLRDAGIEPIVMDVTDQSTIASAVQEITALLEPEQQLWGLVNNAGVVVAGPMEAVDLDDLRYQFEVNVVGQVAVTQQFLPLLRESRGRIVMMSSNSGEFGAPFIGPYCASKFALEGLSDSWRRELRKWDIEVVLVQPGAIRTPIWDKSAETNNARADKFTPAMQLYYGAATEAMQSVVERQESRASDARVVVDAVRHALVAHKPKPRYKVGADVYKPLIAQAVLPTFTADKLILREMGLGEWLKTDGEIPI